MIRILLKSSSNSRSIATRKGLVECLAILGDMLVLGQINGHYMKLSGYLDGYRCDGDEGFMIVVHHGTVTAQPTDLVEIRLNLGVERYTLSELRDCFTVYENEVKK